MSDYKIEQGDCLELMKAIPAGSIDMILTDLPFGTTNCPWDEILPFDELWENFNRVTKENAAVVLFSTQPFTTKLIASNIKNFRYCWYWKKNKATGGIFAKVQPMRCIEDICVFYRKKPVYNPQGLKPLKNPYMNRKSAGNQVYDMYCGEGSIQLYEGYPSHFLEFNRPTEGFHPTQKPVALLQYLIRTYTNGGGDTVLDCTMGSGSTGVACMEEGRKFIGFEKEEKYFKIASKRIANVTMKLF